MQTHLLPVTYIFKNNVTTEQDIVDIFKFKITLTAFAQLDQLSLFQYICNGFSSVTINLTTILEQLSMNY